jgi:hypothetical protein
MADWRPRVRRQALLWLLVPGVGLLELGLQLWVSSRAPGVEAWRAVAAAVAAAKRPGEPVVVAPAWAEPLARMAFGDRVFPLAELARPDERTVPRVLEVAADGAHAALFRSWPVVKAERHGAFTLRILQNPHYRVARYRFVDHVTPAALTVAVVTGGRERPCEFTDHARVTAGGLHGQVAFPAERFQCPGGDAMFVGVTIIDDQAYEPRRCIWAHPPASGVLRLRFSGVPLGSSLHGFAGLSYFLYRDGVGAPVRLAVASGALELGAVLHRDEMGFRGFDFSTAPVAGQTADIDFFVSSTDATRRDFCFSAEAVE